MTIFYQSFFLSFRVLGHMIVPAIGIFLGSMVVWAVLNLVTLGLAGWVSGPITMAFFSLFGMHVALGLKEGPRRIDLKMLSLYSVVFGLVTMFAKAITGLAASLIAVLVTNFRFGSAVSIKTLANAEQNIQTMFALHTFGVLAIVSFLFFVIVPVVLALPMVRAAHSARGGLSTGLSLRGFWPSFLPLFMVFSVAYVALFYFQIIGFLQTFLPLFLGVILPLVFNLEFPSLPLDTIAKAVVSGLVILWFHGWIWSAAVLAFWRIEGASPKPKVSKTAPEQPETMDLRALRKSRN